MTGTTSTGATAENIKLPGERRDRRYERRDPRDHDRRDPDHDMVPRDYDRRDRDRDHVHDA